MNKFYKFRKIEENIAKNIIFLDIDGVLQPYNNKYRFEHDLTKLPTYFKEKFNDDIYDKINIYDLGACYYDWNEISIGILKELLYKTKSMLVIHSSWKDTIPQNQLVALFKIHQLDEYILDVIKPGNKKLGIKEYLEHNKIDNYLIIDDSHFEIDFGLNFYLTNNFLNINDYYNIIQFFNNKYKVIEDYNYFYLYKNNNCYKLNKQEKMKNNIKIQTLNISNINISDNELLFFINEIIKISKEKSIFIAIIDENKNKKNIKKCICLYREYYNYDLYFLDTLNKGYKFINIFEKYSDLINKISTTPLAKANGPYKIDT